MKSATRLFMKLMPLPLTLRLLLLTGLLGLLAPRPGSAAPADSPIAVEKIFGPEILQQVESEFHQP